MLRSRAHSFLEAQLVPVQKVSGAPGQVLPEASPGCVLAVRNCRIANVSAVQADLMPAPRSNDDPHQAEALALAEGQGEPMDLGLGAPAFRANLAGLRHAP